MKYVKNYKGWLALIALVAVVDLTDEKTMSLVFKETSRTKVGGTVLVLGWPYLTAHLFGLLPDEYDVFKRAGKMVIREK